MIEDYRGLYDFFKGDEEMISKYMVLADEIMAFVNCNYKTVNKPWEADSIKGRFIWLSYGTSFNKGFSLIF
ncbi:MAG: hypothetical protein R6V53_07235 [Candidatus Woesearchaeota archaeon]